MQSVTPMVTPNAIELEATRITSYFVALLKQVYVSPNFLGKSMGSRQTCWPTTKNCNSGSLGV